MSTHKVSYQAPLCPKILAGALIGDLTLNPLGFLSLWFELSLVTCGKAKFCLRMVRWVFPGISVFRPLLMNDRLDIRILERAEKTQIKKKKKFRKALGYYLFCFPTTCQLMTNCLLIHLYEECQMLLESCP